MSQNNPSLPHILVVDDEEDMCELLALRLEHHGYRVTTAQTCAAALAVVSKDPADAIVVDLRLDDESGLDLLTEVQTRSLDIPVIILTAHGSIGTAVEAMRRGAYGFLTKPFDDHELLQKLAHAVERVRLRREVASLRRLLDEPGEVTQLIGVSASLAMIRHLIARIAPTEATVLLMGESGTGKEVAARSIHELSLRRMHPFVAVNCGALPADLLESELFGYRRGAFTGALRDKDGLFAAAAGGTLFLDEIGEAPAAVQVKLLRVLQERYFLPVGATEPLEADVRIVAATNRDLRLDVASGRFREDLFYRLHVVPIKMPALRERPEDIPLLAELFLARGAATHGIRTPQLAQDTLGVLTQHDWPGNVRELANVVEAASLLCQDGVLRPAHLQAVLFRQNAALPTESASGHSDPVAPLVTQVLPGGTLPSLREARDAFERAYLMETLRRTEGNVTAAAKLAGRNRTDFHALLRRHDLDAQKFRD